MSNQDLVTKKIVWTVRIREYEVLQLDSEDDFGDEPPEWLYDQIQENLQTYIEDGNIEIDINVLNS